MLALGTALCTALGGLILVEVTKLAGGVMAVSRWRTLSAAIMLGALLLLLGTPVNVTSHDLWMVFLSSVTAAVLAEWALNASYARIGARQTALLFALAAPIAAALGWLVLGETVSYVQLLGGSLVIGGIVLAILFGPRRPTPAAKAASQLHQDRRNTLTAYAFGLIAAVGQAVGTILIRPVMASGADPIAVMAGRAVVAAAVFWGIFLARRMMFSGSVRDIMVPPPRILAWVIIGAAISFVIGMSLMMRALADTGAGVASTLAATTPVIVLPLLWMRTGHAPGWQAWMGAFATVLGCALVLSS